METPTAMLRKLCKEIEIKSIRAKFDSEEKDREWKRNIDNIEL